MKFVSLTDEQIRLIVLLVRDAVDSECGEDEDSDFYCSHQHASPIQRLHLRDALFSLECAERRSA